MKPKYLGNRIQAFNRFKASETLLGIETILAITSSGLPSAASDSKPLKPF
ncbi:hypothetical protein APA_3319 [Pseudanabaena sp. lw0831]|nr:hypothetical protein APA_3319 [Pseudanabaena sp. lw0831]